MNILVINTSVHDDRSPTRAMIAAYLDAMADQHPDVVEHDLSREPLPHLSKEAAAVIRGEPGAIAADGADSDALIAELEAADVIVLGAPMYNFGIPSTLKAWVDHVVRARRTFGFEGGVRRGLLDPAKKVLLFTSSGGVYSSGPAVSMDFVEPYLRAILGFMGISDITVVRAEGQAMGDRGASHLADAISTARMLGSCRAA